MNRTVQTSAAPAEGTEVATAAGVVTLGLVYVFAFFYLGYAYFYFYAFDMAGGF